MKYNHIQAFEKHLESSAPDHFAPLYLILGKEAFNCKRAVDSLIQALLPKEENLSFCLRSFDGQNIEIQEVLTELYSISFLAEKRVIWIQQADKLRKDATEALEQYFTHCKHCPYLILTASALQKNTHFYKKIENVGVILELLEEKPWEKEKRLIDWVSKQATMAHKLMSYQDCQYFTKHVGIDQALLQQELNKLFCYVGDKIEITQKDIKAVCTPLNIETMWQLGEAIFRRDSITALGISQAILKQEGVALLPFLRQLRTQFQTEYQVCTILAQGGQASDVSQDFPYMKGQVLERHMQLAHYYGLEGFKKGLLAIDAAELTAKNSLMHEDLLINLLIVKLIQPL